MIGGLAQRKYNSSTTAVVVDRYICGQLWSKYGRLPTDCLGQAIMTVVLRYCCAYHVVATMKLLIFEHLKSKYPTGLVTTVQLHFYERIHPCRTATIGPGITTAARE